MTQEDDTNFLTYIYIHDLVQSQGSYKKSSRILWTSNIYKINMIL